jgi:hypothetical protein
MYCTIHVINHDQDQAMLVVVVVQEGNFSRSVNNVVT